MPQGGARGQNLGHLYSCHLVIPSVYFKKKSLLVEILKGSLLLHLMTIGSNTVH